MGDGQDLADALTRNIPLSEMLTTLRRELLAARSEGESSDLKFNVEKVELTLQVTIAENQSTDGKLSLMVLGAGGTSASSAQGIHTFKLTLSPEVPAPPEPVPPTTSPRISDMESERPR